MVEIRFREIVDNLQNSVYCRYSFILLHTIAIMTNIFNFILSVMLYHGQNEILNNLHNSVILPICLIETCIMLLL